MTLKNRLHEGSRPFFKREWNIQENGQERWARRNMQAGTQENLHDNLHDNPKRIHLRLSSRKTQD